MSAVVKVQQDSLLVGLHYRPPGTLTRLESALHLDRYERAIILGYFNIDLLHVQGSPGHIGMSQIINKATQTSINTRSLIDRVYVSSNSSHSVLPPIGCSDHSSISLMLSLTQPTTPRCPSRKVWLYHKADFESINNTLAVALPEVSEEGCKDVNSLWETFKSTFLAVAELKIPSKVVSGGKSLPWLTGGACVGATWRTELGTAKSWTKFREWRNKAVKALRQAKDDFFSSLSRKFNH